MKRGKKAQVTLFIIIAVIVVAIIVLALVLVPRMMPRKEAEKEAEPTTDIEDCVKLAFEEIKDNIEYSLCRSEGPEIYDLTLCYYDYPSGSGNYVPILCFNNISGQNCKQREMPALLSPENEADLNESIDLCIDKAINTIKEKGYDATRCEEAEWNIGLAESEINLNIKCPIIVKNEATYSYESFDVQYPTELDTLWPLDLQNYTNEIYNITNYETTSNILGSDELEIIGITSIKFIDRTSIRIGREGYYLGLFGIPNPNNEGYKFVFAIMERI